MTLYEIISTLIVICVLVRLYRRSQNKPPLRITIFLKTHPAINTIVIIIVTIIAIYLSTTGIHDNKNHETVRIYPLPFHN